MVKVGALSFIWDAPLPIERNYLVSTSRNRYSFAIDDQLSKAYNEVELPTSFYHFEESPNSLGKAHIHNRIIHLGKEKTFLPTPTKPSNLGNTTLFLQRLLSLAKQTPLLPRYNPQPEQDNSCRYRGNSFRHAESIFPAPKTNSQNKYILNFGHIGNLILVSRYNPCLKS